MNATQTATFNHYRNQAALLNSDRSVGAVRKTLITFGFTAKEVVTEAQVRAAAADSRTALLHRSRAVKATAKARNAA